MPVEKELTKLIPRIYKWNVENTGLFFWIKAQQQLFPTLTIDNAIKNFIKFTGMSFRDWDIESMRVTFFRLQNDFYGKNETTKTNC
jgi:DNA-binding transcriptional MocR family regulator